MRQSTTKISSPTSLKRKKEELEAKRKEYLEGLPHLYGWKWYRWARAFFEAKNKMCLLCSANQISKSSTQIRKAIHWATEKSLWPKLWATRPMIFWYLYPSKDVATIEFETKWVTEFLPRGKFKNDPKYGWDVEYDGKFVVCIHFHSGVKLFFKTYTQDVSKLQTSTVFAVFCFPENTPVITRSGVLSIQDVEVGDVVLSDCGWKKVTRVYRQTGTVLTKEFPNGRRISATAEHPFFTYNRGWVRFCEIKTSDRLASVHLPMLNWFYSKAFCIKDTVGMQTQGKEITSGARGSFFMLLFGRLTRVGKFPMGLLSTIKTSILLIVLYQIWRVLHEVSIRRYTKEKSGRRLKPIRSNATSVVLSFCRGLLKTKLLGIVLKSVESSGIGRRGFALLAELGIKRSLTATNDSALKLVQTKTSSVFNLEVEDSHTYFADGFLVHNCDEELPEDLYSELNARLTASNGYFSMVFTATLNQEMWWRAVEGRGAQELFPNAFKLQISMWDCILYEDGSPSQWTEERIREVEASCKSETERLRRVEGRFVTEEGRTYGAYNVLRNMVKPFHIPFDWQVYAAVDLGTGGASNHPAAIVFLAVRPDNKFGAVFRGWRGDGIVTTAGDVLEKYRQLRGNLRPTIQKYDWHAKDFGILAERAGEGFTKAEKSHELGESTVNTLFKHGMMVIFDDDPELAKLSGELTALLRSTPKTKARDDFCDALRYDVMSVPWDWSDIKDFREEVVVNEDPKPLSEKEYLEREIRLRRGESGEIKEEDWGEFDDEIEEWNEAYGN